MFVLGTAGHVDHGKSSLVRALTGIDPDRLAEEKRREMTIDLGYAWLTLGDGSDVGIVDVPGHERFVRNMVAGAGEIDAILFVVAADDGWMPQSEEHMHIVDLLGVSPAVIALTKIDLVAPEQLPLVAEEIRARTAGTVLEGAPLVPCSSITGEGLEELRAALEDLARRIRPRRDIAKPRLAIDRAFTLSSAGLVVTGTLVDGSLSVGQEVEILPQRLRARIRAMQRHERPVSAIGPGTRLALNLAGPKKEQLRRGNLVTLPGQDEITDTLDVELRVLPLPGLKIKHGTTLTVHLATAECEARVSLLGRQELGPGERAFARLRLARPLSARLGDRFVLRSTAMRTTVGGGRVLDPFPHPKLRRHAEILRACAQRAEADLAELARLELTKRGIAREGELLRSSPFSAEEITRVVDALEQRGEALRVRGRIVSGEVQRRVRETVAAALREDHRARPWARGLGIAELASRCNVERDLFREMLRALEDEGLVQVAEEIVSLAGHEPTLPGHLQAKAAQVRRLLGQSPRTPPTRERLLARDPDFAVVLDYLKARGEVVEPAQGVLFLREEFSRMCREVVELIRREGPVTVARVRDALGSTRRYVLALLGWLDARGVTVREGDLRRLTAAYLGGVDEGQGLW